MGRVKTPADELGPSFSEEIYQRAMAVGFICSICFIR
jgi:hypothetical protein